MDKHAELDVLTNDLRNIDDFTGCREIIDICSRAADEIDSLYEDANKLNKEVFGLRFVLDLERGPKTGKIGPNECKDYAEAIRQGQYFYDKYKLCDEALSAEVKRVDGWARLFKELYEDRKQMIDSIIAHMNRSENPNS